MTFLEGLTLVFLYLRTSGQIHWNWGLVFLPLIFDWVVDYVYREIKRQKREQFEDMLLYELRKKLHDEN